VFAEIGTVPVLCGSEPSRKCTESSERAILNQSDYCAVAPPSIRKLSPVTIAEAGDAR